MKVQLIVFLFFGLCSAIPYGRRNRCIVKNFRFHRNIQGDKNLGRWYEQEITPIPGENINLRLRKNVATTVHITPTVFANYLIGREPATNQCKEETLICKLTDPTGSQFNITFIHPPEPFTLTMDLAATDYTGYRIFYACWKSRDDGTCESPFTIVESRKKQMSRRDNYNANRILRKLCIDRNMLINLRDDKFQECPEPVLDLNAPLFKKSRYTHSKAKY